MGTPRDRPILHTIVTASFGCAGIWADRTGPSSNLHGTVPVADKRTYGGYSSLILQNSSLLARSFSCSLSVSFGPLPSLARVSFMARDRYSLSALSGNSFL